MKSVRFHYLSYDSLITPGVISCAGFSNDSTVGYSSNAGFRAGTSFPFFLWDWQTSSSTDVLEFPLHVMDVAIMRQQTDCTTRCLEMLDAVRKTGGCLNLLWHTDADEKRWTLYETILRRAKDQGAWLCTIKEANDWWRQHIQSLE